MDLEKQQNDIAIQYWTCPLGSITGIETLLEGGLSAVRTNGGRVLQQELDKRD